jgi:hypothetical protein
MKRILVFAVISVFCVPFALAQAPAAPAKKEMKKMDPEVHKCREHNGKEHADVMKMHADAKKAGNISKGEEKHFHAMEQRLHKHRAILAKDGLTLQECHALGKEIAHEKAVVAKMASTPAKAPAKK